jgi:hypothetical protein
MITRRDLLQKLAAVTALPAFGMAMPRMDDLGWTAGPWQDLGGSWGFDTARLFVTVDDVTMGILVQGGTFNHSQQYRLWENKAGDRRVEAARPGPANLVFDRMIGPSDAVKHFLHATSDMQLPVLDVPLLIDADEQDPSPALAVVRNIRCTSIVLCVPVEGLLLVESAHFICDAVEPRDNSETPETSQPAVTRRLQVG